MKRTEEQGAAPRGTKALSLRDHDVEQEFRRELIEGLIHVHTANRLPGVIRMTVGAAPA